MSKNDSQISTRSTDTQADRSLAPAPLADAATFGEFVRNHREARQISLQQIADATKIGVRQLSALERDDLQNWPGGVYRRAMIRAYAGAIGLDGNDRVLAFIRALKETDSPDFLPDAAERQVSRSAATRLSLARISRFPMALIAPCSSSVIAHLSASFTRRPRGILLYAATAGVFGLVGWYAGSRTAESRSDAQLVSPGPTFTDAAAATTGTGTAVLVRTGNPVTARGRPSADTSPAGFDRAVLSTDDVSRLARILDTEAVMSARNAETGGVLRATSNPSGARVTVNGVGWGYTPLTIRHVPIGEKRVRISKDGYVSAERRIELTGDRPVRAVQIDLKARREAVIPQGREGLPQPKQK